MPDTGRMARGVSCQPRSSTSGGSSGDERGGRWSTSRLGGSAERRSGDQARTLSIAKRAAISGFRLLDGGSWNDNLTIEADRRITTDRVVHFNPISPGFFATVGTSLVAGVAAVYGASPTVAAARSRRSHRVRR